MDNNNHERRSPAASFTLGFESLAPEIVQMILLQVHPADAAELVCASRSTRRLFWNEDVGAAEKHLLRVFVEELAREDYKYLFTKRSPTPFGSLLFEVPFRRLPLAYALAVVAILERKNCFGIACLLLLSDGLFHRITGITSQGLTIGPLRDSAWSELLLRKAVELELIDPTDLGCWKWLIYYAAVNDLVEFLDFLPRKSDDDLVIRRTIPMYVTKAAVQNGSSRVLKPLLSFFLVNFASFAEEVLTAAFLTAAECNNVAIWDFLIATYPSFDFTTATSGGLNALECWARAGNATMVRHFLSFTERRDDALRHAAYSGSVETAEALLDAGVNVNSASRIMEETPLLLAAGQGHVDMIKVLVARGADVTFQGWSSPLIAAARRGHIAAMRTLLDFGADPEAQPIPSKHCLDELGFATSRIFPLTAIPDFVAIVDDIVARAPCIVKYRSFWVLESAKHPELIRCLVRHGADVNCVNPDSNGPPTPLHAVLKDPLCFQPQNSLRTTKLVEAFVSLGADVNLRNSGGQTPLILLSLSKYREEATSAAKMLLDAGADISAVDAEGRSANEFLHDNYFLVMASIIEELPPEVPAAKTTDAAASRDRIDILTHEESAATGSKSRPTFFELARLPATISPTSPSLRSALSVAKLWLIVSIAMVMAQVWWLRMPYRHLSKIPRPEARAIVDVYQSRKS
ncbi:hypothetical protein HDU96_000661 [Phlyctochytrium bullatum]|nr:hypothetical protein HDU96_000661 [Phlyctochytrium bullatum]